VFEYVITRPDQIRGTGATFAVSIKRRRPPARSAAHVRPGARRGVWAPPGDDGSHLARAVPVRGRRGRRGASRAKNGQQPATFGELLRGARFVALVLPFLINKRVGLSKARVLQKK
jgi:hypothetical protein